MNSERVNVSYLRWILAALPVLSFVGQYLFSQRAGTLELMLRHPTVTYVDWIFVPFNFLVVKTIDWRRGIAMYVIWAISASLVILTHAVWQVQGVDPGHMISKAGVVLPAGWIHIVFSCLEMVLLVAFVFCRKPFIPSLSLTSGFAFLYFLAMAVSGYYIHHAIIPSDLCVFLGGVFFVLAYPRLTRDNATYAEST